MICETCRHINAEGARFCNECGATLLPAPVPPGLRPHRSAEDAVAAVKAEPKDELIGRTIDGRYRIDGLIGMGGMGSVYLVTRLLIGDEVAMKILHTERVANPHAAERFRREAQAAAKLKHPNAVSIYDFGITSDGLQYLVMELLEGLSLRQIIKQQGPLALLLAAEITTQVCAALDEAHRRNIVHRDIKPDNIIINSTVAGLRVKVLDFGIAKLRDEMTTHLTQTGSVMGTPHYMSPEQCLGEELDNRADIYSMGIVLYEMLCGRVPFNSPISTAVVIQHVNQPPPPLHTINPAISSAVEATVLHALEKHRDARPPTAGALAQELTAAVHSASAQADHPRWPTAPAPTPVPASGEKFAESAVRTPSSNEMPTVHLPATPASGQTAKVQSTLPSGRVSVVKSNRRMLLAIGAAGLGIVLLVAFVALIAWSLTRREKPTGAGGSAGEDTQNTTNQNPPQGMALVRGGKFTMGANGGDILEQPAHEVTVPSFFVDIYEVTREDYLKFIKATGNPVPQGWSRDHYPPGTGTRPVTGVSWDDANAYAKWAGKRLPTEAEWEFAARGPDGRRYTWGNSWKKNSANAASTSHPHVAEVGEHSAGSSPFGAFDMAGNAWEWTTSDLTPYSGGQLPERFPDGSEVKRGKVIRGGSYRSNSDQSTTTFRRGLPPNGENYEDIGFRCVKDLGGTGRR